MGMDSYRARVLDALLKKRLEETGAVLMEGPKGCGKTTTARQLAGSTLYMTDPEQGRQNRMMADISPRMLLEGRTPRLIDEWQTAPKLWDAVRFEADHREELGQFILTGSAVPVTFEDIYHTGAGRFSRLFMRPMSLYESLDSSGEVSLRELFQGPEEICGENRLDLTRLSFLVCRGGWPQAAQMTGETALAWVFNYYDAVVRSDISRVDGVNRNPERVKRLMRVLARQQGTQGSQTAIGRDAAENEKGTFDEDTVRSYLCALKKIFVVEDMEAWLPVLRSRTAIRTKDTRYFVDPSLACAALGLGPQDLLDDLNTFGFLFETMCMRDLRVFADALGGKVYHYRDKTGLECDGVISLRNGSYGLIEVKLGGERLIREGADSLKKLQEKFDLTKMKAPSFLMVLTGVGQFAYRRPDGVYIVPLGCLKD